MAVTVDQAIFALRYDVEEYNRNAQGVVKSGEAQAAALAKVEAAAEAVTKATRETTASIRAQEGAFDRNIQLENRRADAILRASRNLQDGKYNADQYVAQVNRINTSIDSQIAALNRVGGSYRSFGTGLQQVGYQVGDFFVQVASGQGVLRPLIQQGSQVAGAFGPWGAILGAAAAAAGALAVAMGGLGDETKTAEEAQKAYNKALESYDELMLSSEELSKKKQQSLRDETRETLIAAAATKQKALAELQADLAFIQRLQNSRRVRGGDADLTQGAATASAEAVGLQLEEAAIRERIALLVQQGELSAYFAEIDKGLKLQKDGIEARVEAERSGIEANEKAQKEADDMAKKAADERVKAAKAYGDELNRWIDGQQEVLKGLGESVKAETERTRAGMAANDNLEEYIRKLEDAATIDAGSTEEKKVQTAIIEAQNKLYDKQGEKLRDLTEEEKARIAVAVRTAEAIEEQRKVTERVLDRIADAGGDILFDAWTGKAGNFWETFERFGKRALANLAAEQITQSLFRPIVGSVVGAVPGLFGIGGGGFGGSGSIGGAGATMGVGSSAASATGGGSIFDLLSLGSSGYQLATGNSLLSSVGGWLGLGGAAAGTGAAIGWGGVSAATLASAEAAGLGATVTGGYGALAGGAGAPVAAGLPWGATLGAAGLGFAGGSLLASLTGGNAIGGGIGGGIGAGAGFLLGGPVGAIVGGLGGSLLGGMFGGGKSVGPNANALFAIRNGRAAVGGAGADNGATTAGVVAVVQDAADALNKVIDAYGLRFTLQNTEMGGYYGADTGLQGGGAQSGQELFRRLIKSPYITSDSATLNTILRNTTATTPEGIVADLDFGKLYDAAIKLQPVTLQLVDAFVALGATFDENMAKAQQFGLSTEAFRSGTAANFNQEIDRAIRGIVDPLGQALEDFSRVEEARLEYARKIGADIVEVERLNALERMKIVEQSNSNISRWLENQLLGPTSTLTGEGRLAEAQRQFATAQSSGDTARVLQLADVIASLARTLFGGTLEGAQLIDWTRSQVSAYGRAYGMPGMWTGGYAQGGDTIVGEAGPERVWLPRGAYVQPAVQTMASNDDYARASVRYLAEIAGEIRALRISNDMAMQKNAVLEAEIAMLRNRAAG